MTLRRILLLVLVALVSACAQLPSEQDPVVSGAEIPKAEPVAEAEPPPAPPAVAVKAAEAPPQPAPPVDLWQRVRNGYGMPDIDSPLVRDWEQWYSSRPDYMARMVENSSRYLFYIVEEVERRNMPTEIALLPMIESAYNPQAYSRSHASGIWQFIPSTGRLYGLRQNWWYDGRRDIIAATNAALDYLEKLHAQFGSWDLALASYNWGEGAVARAIAKNQARGRPGNYESLKMPAETRGYVPKLQAVKNIIADPARFGLQLAAIPNESYFVAVATTRHIDLKLAAQFAEMPLDEFKLLNPAHNKPVIRAGGAAGIVLPKDKVETFLSNLEDNEQPLVSWQAHRLKAGEKPSKIAAKHGISLAELKKINGISGRKRFRTGQPLLVPVMGNAEPYLPDLPAQRVTLRKAVKSARKRSKKTGKVATKQVSRKKTASNGTRVKATVKPTAPMATKKVVVAQQDP